MPKQATDLELDIESITETYTKKYKQKKVNLLYIHIEFFFDTQSVLKINKNIACAHVQFA